MKSKRRKILSNQAYSDATLLMVGAAFSLWRAVFLAHTNQTAKANFEAGYQLFEKVIRHNIINYSDDVKLQAWSFGFYLNKCRFRLQQIQAAVDLGLGELKWLDATLPMETPAQREWTKHFDALKQALDKLEILLG